MSKESEEPVKSGNLVIAEVRFRILPPDPEEGIFDTGAKIFAPVQEDDYWSCSLDIGWLGVTRKLAGADSMQALCAALMILRKEIELHREGGYRFFYIGERAEEFQFSNYWL